MNNKQYEEDLRLTSWGTKVFQQSHGTHNCDNFVLGAHYAMSTVSDEHITRIITLKSIYDTLVNSHADIRDSLTDIKFIQTHLHDNFQDIINHNIMLLPEEKNSTFNKKK